MSLSYIDRKTFCLIYKEYTFFSSTHKTLIKIKPTLGGRMFQQISKNYYHIDHVFFNYSVIKLESNNKMIV